MSMYSTTYVDDIREIKEETGLDTKALEIIEVRGRSRPQRMDVWIRCVPPAGKPRLSAEVDEIRFFELDQLPPLIAEQKEFLRRYLSHFPLDKNPISTRTRRVDDLEVRRRQCSFRRSKGWNHLRSAADVHWRA